MEPTRLTPHVWQLTFPVGHVHLVRIPAGYALVDTGVPGSAPAVLAALERLGGRPEDVRQIVLTHFHLDHTGSAAELAAATGAHVLAGAPDAPFIRGTAEGPGPTLTASERPVHEGVMAGLAEAGTPAPAPVRVDRELHDGDQLGGWDEPDGWGEPVRVLHVPGHTPGSVALHLTTSGVLFPGDTIATDASGRAMLGPFNVDRAQALASFRRLAALDVETVCVPHGPPLVGDARTALTAATPERDWA